ncbi:type VI secretion system tube protein Hcp [Paraburkholderia sp. MMS20-SJTR3]|uniref:Type VI secretion system tube protein Hcp n=1 Tax=Paraburkholderia sejongensis TaxID=2886946 RepID=A0ABS8JTC3_9BURK|nr:type VI secretion system tube protein Hcp [Paraburkholderia sp. MMS20-SJTR3]MCC8393151.1 type VI secretion system tube protein Hcp [Paraburkholderia sp. MMS20-SJTR3]
MTQDIFIKIAGIDGESQDAAHLNEIDVISWRWKVGQQSAMQTGSGVGAPKANVSDLEFSHQLDRASPNLARFCFSGERISEAKLTMRRAGGVPHEYARITLYDVVVAYVEPVGVGAGCYEEVRLSFARMKHEYILQNRLGGTSGTVTALIDVRTNRLG